MMEVFKWYKENHKCERKSWKSVMRTGQETTGSNPIKLDLKERYKEIGYQVVIDERNRLSKKVIIAESLRTSKDKFLDEEDRWKWKGIFHTGTAICGLLVASLISCCYILSNPTSNTTNSFLTFSSLLISNLMLIYSVSSTAMCLNTTSSITSTLKTTLLSCHPTSLYTYIS